MSKRVFVCNTVFQVLVAIWVNHKYFQDEKKTDIIISNHMNSGRNISDRMRQYGNFDNTYYVESFMFARHNPVQNRLTHIKNELDPCSYLNSNFDINFDYEHIFIANLDLFSKSFFNAAVKKNPNVRIHIFEDGLSTYSNLFGSWFEKSGRPDYNFLRSVFFNCICKKKYIKDHIEDIWIFNPELLQWDPKIPVKAIKKIDSKDKDYLEICNRVFNYYNSKDVYDKKYIFMEESFYTEGESIPDVELVNQIAQRVGKENIMVKIHPRNTVNRFAELGYKTNKDTGVPWELICMNMDDLDEKILFTISSSSILNPIMILGIPVKAFSLCNVVSQLSEQTSTNKYVSPLWDTVKFAYEKCKPSITICNSIEEIL